MRTASTHRRWAPLWVMATVLGLTLGACGSDAGAPAPAAGDPRPLAAEAPAQDPAPTGDVSETPVPTSTPAPPATTTIPEPPVTTTTEAASPRPATANDAPPGPTLREPPDEPADPLLTAVQAALAATVEAGTAAIDGEATGEGASVSFTGTIEIEGRIFAGELTFEDGPPLTTVIVGDVAYLAKPDLPFGATWEELPHDDAYPASSQTLDMPFGFVAVLAAIDSGQPLVDLGAADGGEPHRLVGFPLDVARLLAAADLDPGWFGAWSEAQLSVSAQVRIDDAGLIAEVTVQVDPGYDGEDPFEARYSLTDVGIAAAIELPADADIARPEDFGVAFGSLDVGDCFSQPSLSGTGIVYGVIVVPCDEPHAGEVFAVASLDVEDGAPYPGQEAVWEMTSDVCIVEFEDYVGEPLAASELDFWAVYPTQENWQHGDRLVVCSAINPDLSHREGSVRDRQL